MRTGIAFLEGLPSPNWQSRHISVVLCDGADIHPYDYSYDGAQKAVPLGRGVYNHGLFRDAPVEELGVLQATLDAMVEWPIGYTLFHHAPPCARQTRPAFKAAVEGRSETPVELNCVTSMAAALLLSGQRTPFLNLDLETMRAPCHVADAAMALSPTPNDDWQAVAGGLAWHCRTYGVGYQAVTERLKEALRRENTSNTVVMTLEM